ncbi:MAG: hypothetical protein FJ279_20925 [Planctomycetes bacterium]|nr:hypothetical protein [Planctomycetota bacterium]
MKITVTRTLERALAEQAHKEGTTPEKLALDCLQERFLPSDIRTSVKGEQRTLADFLAGHIGVLSSREHVRGGARMSENSGKRFAAGLARKRREGRL